MIAVSHVKIQRSQDMHPVFIPLYINSAAGQLQVKMHQRGSSGQLGLYSFAIRAFLICSAPQALQRTLRSLIDQAFEAKRESKDLPHQAKTRVEQLIEETMQS
ncbi:MAG: hypothetical protein AB2L11_04340 [Syntrophobacteraceae bacterium]